MQLGKYTLDRPVFLAPMAGVTDKAFREIVRMLGGLYVVTEMISDKALTYHNSRTLNMLNLEGESSPRIVQIFGSEPETMAEAARIVESQGADIIDINMGCPTPKIVKNGEGSALLRDKIRAQAVAKAVVEAVKIPVTVKMRLGWDKDSIVAPELARMLEAVGVQMLAVHGRTREQFYSGEADWNWIKKVREAVNIPVLGNGDITSPEKAREMLELTGCDGVMIGRAALGNPWLIPRTEHYLRYGEVLPEPTTEEKIKVAIKHFQLVLTYKGERIGLNEMRKHAAWYIKGIKGAASYREQIMRVKQAEEMMDVFTQILSHAS